MLQQVPARTVLHHPPLLATTTAFWRAETAPPPLRGLTGEAVGDLQDQTTTSVAKIILIVLGFTLVCGVGALFVAMATLTAQYSAGKTTRIVTIVEGGKTTRVMIEVN